MTQPKKKKSRSGPSLTASQRRANGLELLQGLWLPAELVARLRGACERLGVTRTQAVGEAVEGWLRRTSTERTK